MPFRPYVDDRGRGHPVLLVHGQPGLGSDWEQVAARLRDHRLLIVDRPGYGRSGDRTTTLEGNAEILAALLEERGAAPATVVGHSYGGGVAILLAAHRPELVAGLVLVGSVGRAASLTVADRAMAVPVLGDAITAAGLFAVGRVLPRLRAATGAHRYPGLDWLRASLPDDTYEGVSAEKGRKVWHSFVAEQRTLLDEIAGIEAALGSIRAPTAVLSGAWDLVVPPVVAASIAAAVPGAELVSVARTGHFVPRDAPATVAAAVRAVEARAQAGRERGTETGS